MRTATLLLLLAANASAAAAPGDPSPAELLARAGRGRVEFLRAVAEESRFAPRLTEKRKLYPYLTGLDALARAGERWGLESLGADPVRDLGEELSAQAGKWLRLDADPADAQDAFFKWSNNDARVSAAGDAALLAAEAGSAEELLAWDRGARAALARLRGLRADASALQAFEDLHGVVVRLLLERADELPPARLEETAAGASSPAALSEVLAFLDAETETARTADRRRRVLTLAIAAARGSKSLGRAAPLRLRTEAGALVASALEVALHAGDPLDEGLARAAVAAVTPAQAAQLLEGLGSLYADAAPPADQARAVRAATAALSARFPALAAARRREFERLAAAP